METNVIYANMPATIKAYTVNNNDDTYTVVLNSKLNREQHLISYHHEMQHIENGDYEKKTDIDIIEINAHSSTYERNLIIWAFPIYLISKKLKLKMKSSKG